MRTPLAIGAAAVIGALGCAGARPPGTDSWPTRPVRLIVPAGAGTGVDLAARVFAPRLAARWRHPVVVDNRPGADGVTGTQAFVTAKDASTLLFAPAGSVTFAPHVHAQLPYDPVHDVTPISAIGSVTVMVAASTAIEARSLRQLADLARQQPGAYRWAAGSPGGPELVVKAFIEQERLQMAQVRYREVPLALQDVGAGRVHVVLGALPTLATLLESGRIRPLAVTNSVRSAAAPEVPTVAEAGYAGLTLDGLWGVFGARDMPIDLRRRIAADIGHAARDPELAARLVVVGLSVRAGTPEQFAAELDRQRAQAATLARASGSTRD